MNAVNGLSKSRSKLQLKCQRIGRTIIFAIWALVCVCLSISEVAASSSARQQLENAVNEIIACVQDPDFKKPSLQAAKRAQVEKIALEIFDPLEFSSRTVGARWKTFTDAQKQEFANAFSDLLVATYINKIDGYSGETVKYTQEVKDSKNDKRMEIRTQIILKNGQPIPVYYRMLQKGNQWRVYDVLIENLSLVKNYREQFSSILNTAKPDELINRIQEKAQQVREQQDKK